MCKEVSTIYTTADNLLVRNQCASNNISRNEMSSHNNKSSDKKTFHSRFATSSLFSADSARQADPYKILCLEHLKEAAEHEEDEEAANNVEETFQDIRRSYCRLAVLHHPRRHHNHVNDSENINHDDSRNVSASSRPETIDLERDLFLLSNYSSASFATENYSVGNTSDPPPIIDVHTLPHTPLHTTTNNDNNNNSSSFQFALISAAFETLSDPMTKHQYDKNMARIECSHYNSSDENEMDEYYDTHSSPFPMLWNMYKARNFVDFTDSEVLFGKELGQNVFPQQRHKFSNPNNATPAPHLSSHNGGSKKRILPPRRPTTEAATASSSIPRKIPTLMTCKNASKLTYSYSSSSYDSDTTKSNSSSSSLRRRLYQSVSTMHQSFRNTMSTAKNKYSHEQPSNSNIDSGYSTANRSPIVTVTKQDNKTITETVKFLPSDKIMMKTEIVKTVKLKDGRKKKEKNITVKRVDLDDYYLHRHHQHDLRDENTIHCGGDSAAAKFVMRHARGFDGKSSCGVGGVYDDDDMYDGRNSVHQQRDGLWDVICCRAI